MDINERFTDLADRVSEGMGRWWVTAISIIAVILWFVSGPFMHFSDTWQLIANTPSTILELWIGFLLAAAANRTERHNQAMLAQIAALAAKIEQRLERGK